MTEPALIDIHNTTIWRGATRVFENLSLTIPQHQRVAILGLLAERVSKEQLVASEAILADLGLAEFLQTELKAMSTGEQRRCLLARALVHNPDTLILDEPTAGLDISASFDYLRQISRLAKAGQNIIIVTHHLNEIPPEVERVILLKQGSIAADGSKEETLTSTLLSDIYETRVRVSQVDGHFQAYPG